MARTFYQNTGSGNISSNFNIARIYRNKKTLMQNAKSDGIYLGSYVLVDYDKDYEPASYDSSTETWTFDPSFAYKEGWLAISDDYYEPSAGNYLLYSNDAEEIYYLYSDTDIRERDNPFDPASSFKALDVIEGTVIFVKSDTGETERTKFHYDFYKCIGAATNIVGDENTRPVYAEFEKLSSDYTFNYTSGEVNTGINAYTENYLEDRREYGDIGRGYDNTVWQKAIVNGKQTYVQIADFSSAVPTFNLNMVPPQEDGVSPHVNYQVSSNMYYEMYDSPHWGLRIKDANYNSSRTTDETIYPSDVTNSEDEDLAIYWNENGFNPAKIGKDTTNTVNKINITTTGISGRDVPTEEEPDPPSYKDEQTGETITPGTTVDVQELSIMLPKLGNTISDIWDIVYGGDVAVNRAKWNANRAAGLTDYSESYDNDRITEIKWHNANESEEEKTQGLRFVDENGDIEINTIAGCINSIHDLMGMIIYDPYDDLNNNDIPPVAPEITGDEVADAAALAEFRQKWAELSSNYIYYLNGEYYRRGMAVKLDEDYDPDNLWREVQVTEYDSNEKYFYKDLTNYIRVTEQPVDDIVCYKFNNELVDMQEVSNLSPEFNLENNYFYKEALDDSWNLETENEHRNRDYYNISFSYRALVFWKPGVYYTKIDPNGDIVGNNLKVSNLSTPDSNTVYYYPYSYRNYNATLGRYEYVTGYVGINGAEFTVFTPEDSFKYYYQDSRTHYVPIAYSNVQDYMWKAPDNFDQSEEIRYKKTYAIINEEASDLNNPLNFYHANEYYYKSDENSSIYNYLIDTNSHKQNSRVYYKKNHEPVAVGKFYEPYKFYDHEYNLHWSGYDPNETYYEQEKLYVKESGITEDENHNPVGNGRLYKVGSEWVVEDGQRKTPAHLLQEYGVKCGVKTTYYAPYKLEGFARNLNTIHGILLRLDTLIGDSDNSDNVSNSLLTRDLSTVKGCINQLNDYIDLFDTVVEPDHIMMADKTGKYGTANIISNSWILLDTSGETEERVNPDTQETEEVYIRPQLEINHKLATIDETAASAIDLNSTNSDSINVLVTNFDTAGHATAKKSQTITLPYGFKTVSTNTTGQDNIVADSTQDTLNINSGNSWIQTTTDATNDILTISHETHQKTTTTSTQSLSNESGGETFNVYQYGFDNAGHVTSEDTKTITVPNSYGKISGDTGTVTASATLDTVSITGDTWIGSAAASDAVALTHKAPAVVTPTAQSNETPSFGGTFTITDWHYDSTGHKDGSSTHTVTIPANSLTDTEGSSNANVLTGISLTPSTGAIAVTHQNVGALLLTGYSSAHNKYAATDSINSAFAATEGYLYGLEGNVTTLSNNVNTITSTTIPAAITEAKNYTDSVINILKGDNLSTAFDTLKEIQDWIDDGNQQGTALVNRVATLESSLGDYVLASAAPGYGDILTATNAATIYQTKLIAGTDYVQPSTLGSYLTSADAALTYQPIITSGTYVEPSDTFVYDNSDPSNPVTMTIAQLVAKVKDLEDRIDQLENS